jgi:hypothetical protein
VDSIVSITNMINNIMGNIDKAHISISIIDQSLKNSLDGFGNKHEGIGYGYEEDFVEM